MSLHANEEIHVDSPAQVQATLAASDADAIRFCQETGHHVLLKHAHRSEWRIHFLLEEPDGNH
jgi:hypothetical protein